MNINFNACSSEQISFQSRMPKKFREANVIYGKLGPEFEDIAYCNGVPKVMVLGLIEKNKGLDLEYLGQVLQVQLKAVFNTVKENVDNPEYIKSFFNISENVYNSLMQSYKRVLNEQKMISAYLDEHVSMEKIGRRFGFKGSHSVNVFRRWGVLSLHERNKVAVMHGVEAGLSNTQIAEDIHIREFSVMRLRRVLNYPKYITQKTQTRNAKILERIINGATRAEVAKEFGMSKGSIDRIVQNNDGFAKKIAKRDEAILKQIENNVLYKDIAKEFGISVDTVKRVAKKYRNKKES